MRAAVALPEATLPLRWRRAALQLEARLRESTGQVPQRLDAHVMANCYPDRPYVAGWRIRVRFSDGIHRRIECGGDLRVPIHFRYAQPWLIAHRS